MSRLLDRLLGAAMVALVAVAVGVLLAMAVVHGTGSLLVPAILVGAILVADELKARKGSR